MVRMWKVLVMAEMFMDFVQHWASKQISFVKSHAASGYVYYTFRLREAEQTGFDLRSSVINCSSA